MYQYIAAVADSHASTIILSQDFAAKFSLYQYLHYSYRLYMLIKKSKKIPRTRTWHMANAILIFHAFAHYGHITLREFHPLYLNMQYIILKGSIIIQKDFADQTSRHVVVSQERHHIPRPLNTCTCTRG